MAVSTAWCSCDMVGNRAKLRVWNRGLGTVLLVALEVSAIVVELWSAVLKPMLVTVTEAVHHDK